MDWRVEFTYLNNFMEVVSDFSCDGDININRQYATGTSFSCFTSTKVQKTDTWDINFNRQCATVASTNIQILTQKARQSQTICR